MNAVMHAATRTVAQPRDEVYRRIDEVLELYGRQPLVSEKTIRQMRTFASVLGVGPDLRLVVRRRPREHVVVETSAGRIRFRGEIDLKRDGPTTAMTIRARVYGKGPVGWVLMAIARRLGITADFASSVEEAATELARALDVPNAEWTKQLENERRTLASEGAGVALFDRTASRGPDDDPWVRAVRTGRGAPPR